MFRNFNKLNGGLVTDRDIDVGWQWDLRQADGSRVGIVGWTGDLERRDADMTHVLRDLAETEVDIYQGS